MLKAGKYNTDKSQVLLDTYEELFKDLKDKDVKLFELGVFGGGSLKLWHDYFKKGTIVGLDIDDVDVLKSERVKFYKGNQKDIVLLKKAALENATEGFDIIIDDASHFGYESFVTFSYLFKNHLKSGGIYVIEDWATGYWPHYPDGRNIKLDKHHVSYHLHNETDYVFEKKGVLFNKRRFRSHDFGMVGLVKQLIDELGIEDATNERYTNKVEKNVKPAIKEIIFKVGQVVVIKA